MALDVHTAKIHLAYALAQAHLLRHLGAGAGLERSLIVERVKAGLRNARAKGKRIGRPRVIVDGRKAAALRASGFSWSEIARKTGWTKGTVQRAFYAQTAPLRLPTNV